VLCHQGEIVIDILIHRRIECLTDLFIASYGADIQSRGQLSTGRDLSIAGPQQTSIDYLKKKSAKEVIHRPECYQRVKIVSREKCGGGEKC
jgi:hypothetical protein